MNDLTARLPTRTHIYENHHLDSPRCPGDIKEYWRGWTTRGWFDWQSDGYPQFSATWHARTWWNFRHLPNILLVHSADLLAQPAAEITRVAAFLDIPVTAAEKPFPTRAATGAGVTC